MKTERLMHEMDSLSPSETKAVEEFIADLKRRKRRRPGAKPLYNVFTAISLAATDVGIKDWARNHDHYLYGTKKR